jgi:serine/threonine protein kinase
MADAEALVGQKLGVYEVRSLIALGSMSTVYEGYQPAIKRQVAVRVLNARLSTNPAYVDAFTHEAELMGMLEHPHILPIHDYGSERGHYYMVLRLMRGGSLKDHLKNTDGLPFQESVSITRQLASALDYIHSHNMVNGELSRANILFDGWGNPYIGNLFFANLKAGINEALAWTYAAPERWNGEAATPLSDQYAFGVLTYVTITARKPFQGRGQVLRDQHLNQPPPPPQKFRPEIPLAVNDVLNRALSKNPEDRYPTVMDFAREFEKAIQAVPNHLFISYSRQDKAYAQGLFEHLGGSGFTVWIDSKIEYGDTWFKEIDEAIKSCAAFLLIMTPASYESEWVQKEILLAKRYKKPIFPLLLEGDEFGIVIDLQFADVKGGIMPDVDFHRRLRRTVFGDA